jgi:hypothetical protein
VLVLHTFHERASPDRYRLAPLRLPFSSAVRQGRFDPLVLQRRQHPLGRSQQATERRAIDDAVARRWPLDLVIAGFKPVPRMVHHAGADHVEVDVRETARQMLVGVDRSGVVGA